MKESFTAQTRASTSCLNPARGWILNLNICRFTFVTLLTIFTILLMVLMWISHDTEIVYIWTLFSTSIINLFIPSEGGWPLKERLQLNIHSSAANHWNHWCYWNAQTTWTDWSDSVPHTFPVQNINMMNKLAWRICRKLSNSINICAKDEL